MRAAVAFLTRVPVGGDPYTPAEWRWAASHFPLVGAFLGGILALVWVATARAGPFVAAAVVVAVSMLLTGAFHEDGLADTADALGGAHDRERLFAILKDSRIGSFGAAALIIVILLRVALLARLADIAPVAIVTSGVLARTMPVWLLARLPYVTARGASKGGIVADVGSFQVGVATAWAVATTVALVAFDLLRIGEATILWLAASLVSVVCGARFSSRAGGITGDFLGATQQVSECAVLLALAIARGDAP